jgi:alpha/beta superfamily hydrolase
MNSATRIVSVAGPAGVIDVALDEPAGPRAGVAVIAHPHPLFGGTRDNKVVQTIARALVALGYSCWRPNFRGVGASEGVHDEGRGETEDLLAVVDAATGSAPDRAAGAASGARPVSAPGAASSEPPALLLAGFSFGGFVQSRVADALARAGRGPNEVVLVAPAVSRFEVHAVQARTLLVHGEQDDVVPLPSVLEWARPQETPVVVVPGADHFFHRKLPLLKRIVTEWVRGGPDRAS